MRGPSPLYRTCLVFVPPAWILQQVREEESLMNILTSRTASKYPEAAPARCDRRAFLKGAALAVTGFSAAGPLQALLARPATAVQLPYSPDYGPLLPTPDENTGLELL